MNHLPIFEESVLHDAGEYLSKIDKLSTLISKTRNYVAGMISTAEKSGKTDVATALQSVYDRLSKE